jgi:hypothetical protein
LLIRESSAPLHFAPHGAYLLAADIEDRFIAPSVLSVPRSSVMESVFIRRESGMKRIVLLLIFAFSTAAGLQAQADWSFKGTVIKMEMADCVVQRNFMVAMSGVAVSGGATCPQYTVMSDKVVYVVVGRHSEEFIPLAENKVFLIRKNELVIFSDDEKTKSRFAIQRMTLRADWDREKERKELEAKIMERSVNYEVRNPSHSSVLSTSAR